MSSTRFILCTILAAGLAGAQEKSNVVKNVTASPKKEANKDHILDEARRMGEKHPGYRIGSGDVLDLYVWKEQEASVAGLTVRSDGKITIPFLKEVAVVGMSTVELEANLTRDLGKFIKDPEITVLVKQVNSEKIYVLGMVRKPGTLPLQGPLTVLQAITESGGPTEYAKKKKMYVLRKADGEQKRLPFNYETVIKGLNAEQNINLLPGDTIVVP